MSRGRIQPEAGPGASVSFGLLFGSSVDDDTDGVCADVTRASQGQRRSLAPCQALPHQLRPPRRPVMLQPIALRVFAFTVPTCSCSVRVIARASRSSSLSRTPCDACRDSDICLVGAGAGVGVGARAASCTTMADGGGVLAVLDGAGAAAGGSETGVVPEEMAPSSSEMSFGGAVLPLKYLAADRAGSADGVGGRYRTGTSPTVGVQ